jgi:hypothetical protein
MEGRDPPENLLLQDDHHPITSGKILPDANDGAGKCLLRQIDNRMRLGCANLQHQRATGSQHRRRRHKQTTIDGKTIAPAVERQVRFVHAHPRINLIENGIRRITDQQINRLRQRRQQVAVQKRHAGVNVMTYDILAGNRQRIAGEIDGINMRLGKVDCQRDSDTSTPCTDIGDHKRTGALFRPFQRCIYQRFGFGARHDHTPIHNKLKTVELFPPNQVGNWLTRDAAQYQRAKLMKHFVGNGFLRPGQYPRTRPP